MLAVIAITFHYIRLFTQFLYGLPFEAPNNPKQESSLKERYAKVYVYTMAKSFYMYHKPHYRKDSYKIDLMDNLRNIAIPGTGLPLSFFVHNQVLMMFFFMIVVPLSCFVAAIHHYIKTRGKVSSSIAEEYEKRLLYPDDWFCIWQLNSRLAALHSFVWDSPKGYEMENKWKFLVEGSQKNVPVSPFMKTSGIIIKHANDEGGLGFHHFKNAYDGGDWIIQNPIQNSEFVSKLLPPNAPLSTFRVATISQASTDLTSNTKSRPTAEDISTILCTFRAGREMQKPTTYRSYLMLTLLLVRSGPEKLIVIGIVVVPSNL